MISNRARIRIRRRTRLPGVTFVEVLVVMIILALIAGIVGTQLFGEAEKAKVNATRIQIKSLEAALDLYRLHNSTYPSTEQGLQSLLTQPEVGRIPKNWEGPYLNANSIPTDSWKTPFVYISDGGSVEITSLGADGSEGGDELNADISNKQL
jgi:general secretion pathway protein G